jgi:hypothetical protein
VFGGVIVPVHELPVTMKSPGFDPGVPELAPVKVIGAAPESVTVICCGALTAGGVGGGLTLGMPKERSVGEMDTGGGGACAFARSIESNNTGLHASKIASFFMFIAGRTGIIRPSFGQRSN